VQTESPQQEQTDLGEDVERAIAEFWLNCQQHGDPRKLAMIDCGPCKIALGILENAIRARIEQPGPVDPEAVTVKRFEVNHLRNYVVLLASKRVNRADAAASLEAWIDKVTGKVGSFEGTPLPPEYTLIDHMADRLDEEPPATRAADIAGAAEPKPQHIFERHHVGEGELADRRGAFLPRTSKHSSHAEYLDHLLHRLPWEPFLARFPEIERIGTPVPEGEKPSMTIITALQFKALAETVDLLIAERNAKL
jgi:hypothetical protein